ncbi:hypothetical protein P3342_010929 [Pyrenophora teres f. teres]|nr:hypothetical protein P3342_010929 [Pyrenophora teres f. teres]
MASEENNCAGPNSPRSPRSNHPRTPLTAMFDNLDMSTDTSPGKGKGRARPTTQHSDLSARSSLRGSLSRNWPPSFGDFELGVESLGNEATRAPLNMRVSTLYRRHGDNWARDSSVEDLPADKSEEFLQVSSLMDEIHQYVQMVQENKERLATILMEDMGKVIYGSNEKARKGLGLDETLKFCQQIFDGVEGVEYEERTYDYQAKLEKFVIKESEFAPNHVIRSRREVIQHAAAFHHIVTCFVTKNMPMSEELIKDTHRILVKGVGSGSAGFVSNKEHGGVYRNEDVYVGATSLPKASTVPESMRSMVHKLEKDLNAALAAGRLDPFALASEYCDRLVNIHPFRDGNGRMCRLILNAILIKYAGIVVNVGEHDQSRDEYLQIALESTEVGGHAGALGSLVLTESRNVLRRIKDKLLMKKR